MTEAAREFDLPAYARSLGITVHAWDGGVPVLAIGYGAIVEGRPGHFHGGATAGLLENAGYAALRCRLLAERRVARMKPITITVQYLAAGKGERAFAIGRVIRLGRRNANVSVEAWQQHRDRPFASAIMNILMA